MEISHLVKPNEKDYYDEKDYYKSFCGLKRNFNMVFDYHQVTCKNCKRINNGTININYVTFKDHEKVRVKIHGTICNVKIVLKTRYGYGLSWFLMDSLCELTPIDCPSVEWIRKLDYKEYKEPPIYKVTFKEKLINLFHLTFSKI